VEALGSREHPDLAGREAKADRAAWEELADSGYGRRMNVHQWWIPFDHARVVTRSDLSAFIEGCENGTGPL
jgi:hypothetical protein